GVGEHEVVDAVPGQVADGQGQGPRVALEDVKGAVAAAVQQGAAGALSGDEEVEQAVVVEVLGEDAVGDIGERDLLGGREGSVVPARDDQDVDAGVGRVDQGDVFHRPVLIDVGLDLPPQRAGRPEVADGAVAEGVHCLGVGQRGGQNTAFEDLALQQ